jgi:hypothetical protein
MTLREDVIPFWLFAHYSLRKRKIKNLVKAMRRIKHRMDECISKLINKRENKAQKIEPIHIIENKIKGSSTRGKNENM